MDDNREIYNTRYSGENLRIAPKSGYDRRLTELRFSYVEKYGAGADTLDLCCGSGAYLLPFAGSMRSAVGMDFSSNMLECLRDNIEGEFPPNLSLIEGDASKIPLAGECVDFVYSYTSLYYVPDFAGAADEVSRVLRRGGRAVLEFGNSASLNFWLAGWQHRRKGWAKVFSPSLGGARRIFADAGLREIELRSFQILPMYEAPKELFYMYPLLAPLWKVPLGLALGGRMLDEYVSGAPLLRNFAFRHIALLEKT